MVRFFVWALWAVILACSARCTFAQPQTAQSGTDSKPPATNQPVDSSSTGDSTPNNGSDSAANDLQFPESIAVPEQIPAPSAETVPTLAQLAQSVRLHFPVIQQAVALRTIASGEVLAAQGAFDHKLDGFSNSQPLDFYENYWHNIGLKRDTYWGGQVFAGYRIGRGIYEPWYLERETNKGGEFKAGVVVPLARNRSIDANRAELWRSQIERGRVEPEIRIVIIGAIRDATITYWEWVASAAAYQVAKDILDLGLERRGFLERQVDEGEKADIELVDNQRIIVSRSAKATDARRKLEQSAVKLSLFLRNDFGMPVVLPLDVANVTFPTTSSAAAWGPRADVELAQANRPELEELQLAQQQLAVLLRQARNEILPLIDGGILLGQDVGEPTSSSRDKSEFELEATLRLSVPLERRKALGKARQLRGKIAQLRAKTRFAADKIGTEAQVAHAALIAAAQRVEQTTEGLDLAEQMRVYERRLYELGQSTLFNLNLREKQLADAALERVTALFDYHVALAAYAAALGFETPDALIPQDP